LQRLFSFLTDCRIDPGLTLPETNRTQQAWSNGPFKAAANVYQTSNKVLFFEMTTAAPYFECGRQSYSRGVA
jgi:hypothetical protein